MKVFDVRRSSLLFFLVMVLIPLAHALPTTSDATSTGSASATATATDIHDRSIDLLVYDDPHIEFLGDGEKDVHQNKFEGGNGDEDSLFFSLRHGHRQVQSSNPSSSTRVNIFQKLGESLGLTIIGCCLIALMPCLIWKNEGRHVRELSRIDFCKNKAVAIDCTTATNETVGRLVHFTGDVTVGGGSVTFETGGGLNLAEPLSHAVLVRRICYIWQRFEIAQQSTQRDMIGGGETRTTTYSLKEDWTAMGPQKDCPNLGEVNSRGVWDQLVVGAGGSPEPVPDPEEQAPVDPRQQGGMKAMMATAQQGGNIPLEMALALGLFDPKKLPHAMEISNSTRVGGFALSEKIITGNPAVFSSDYAPVPPACIPDYVPGCEFLMKGSDNVLRSFPESEAPKNGDVKVVYEYVADGFPASFLVAQTDMPADKSEAQFGVDEMLVTEEHCLGQCQDDLGHIWMVRKGSHSLYEMIDMAKQDEAMTVKLIRVVAWVLLCIGWVMLFSPFLTALQVLPLLSQIGYFAVVLVALIVSALCCCTIMIFAYLRYRPLLSGGLLLVALGIWGIVAWRLNVAADTGGDTNSTNTTRF